MNRGTLVKSVAKQTKLTKAQSNAVLGVILEDIKKEVKKNGGVRLVGFGTFKKATRKARNGRNPRTGEAIKIAKKIYPKFVPSKGWTC